MKSEEESCGSRLTILASMVSNEATSPDNWQRTLAPASLSMKPIGNCHRRHHLTIERCLGVCTGQVRVRPGSRTRCQCKSEGLVARILQCRSQYALGFTGVHRADVAKRRFRVFEGLFYPEFRRLRTYKLPRTEFRSLLALNLGDESSN
jgi:hypothetical protein